MRDPKRISRILEKLETLWNKMPDLRFGQLLINEGIVTDDLHVWYREDDVLEEALANKVKAYDSRTNDK